ncbi:DUF5686 and carboxypeptidase regulatory-like domain-containing protein [soil metagenome]
MKLERILLWLLLLCIAGGVQAGVITGIVTSIGGEPLPFANVYVQGTTFGTTTNGEGNYRLDLSAGTYQIVYQYIGYKKKITEIVVGTGTQRQDMVLEAEDIRIQEVVVNAGEDPAYPIMRKAIEQRDRYYNMVQAFKCQAYVKGMQRLTSAPDKVFGFEVNFDGTLDSNNAGIVYLSESISELSMMKPDKVKEVMISSKVSGDSRTFSWNRASDLAEFDFYRSSLRIDFLSERIFISPLSDNAFMYYKFRLEGVFSEDGKLINKIAVIPKRGSDPVFRGYIYIVENDWRIHSTELTLVKESQINYLDTLNFNYTYVPVNDSIWMPVSQYIDFTFSILGINGEGYFVAVYRDYVLNPPFTKKDFSNEILVVTKESNEKDSTYWGTNRPVPLTENETADYVRKDSLEVLINSKPYLDSLSRKSNKFKPLDVLFGYQWNNYYKKFNFRTNSIVEDLIHFNTMEGWNLRIKPTITKEFENRKLLVVSPAIRYGFTNRHFNGYVAAQYHYSRPKFAYVNFEIGQYVYQFNRDQPITDLMNTFYTLFIKKNFLKAFEERFVRISQRIEIANGLMLWAGAGFAERYNLKNTHLLSILPIKSRDFEPNVPQSPEYERANYGTHRSFSFNLRLRWTPGSKYISRPDQKIALGSKFPTFYLSYRKGIPNVGGSITNFDYLEFEMAQDIRMGLAGTTRYIFKAGGFPNNKLVPFQDYRHFQGDRTVFGKNYLDGFLLLNYYVNSTNNWFAEGHYVHHFDGFVFNKIPGVRKLKWQLVAGGHIVYTPEYNLYGEVNIGIENIFKVLRIDFVSGFGKDNLRDFGVRVGFEFGQQ